MYKHLEPNINIIQVPFAPFIDGVDRKVKLSNHLTIGELYDSTKVLNKNDLNLHGIPVHPNFLQLFELLRSHTKEPLYLGSSYRSHNWEVSQNRTGTSQHVQAIAYDFNGKNLSNVLDEALETKNTLYKELRKIGVNAYGQYSWGYHLDFRNNKPNNEIYFWSEKKKTNNLVLLSIIALILFYIKKSYKKWKI